MTSPLPSGVGTSKTPATPIRETATRASRAAGFRQHDLKLSRGGLRQIPLGPARSYRDKGGVKRLIDVVGSFVGLVAFAPLLAVVAVAVKLHSPGPVLYRSERWGRGGCRIRILKFRTMVHGAERLLESEAALKDAYEANIKLLKDPRVTRLGWWLRRWSIDELPQLYNVLVGELSLVGPRPKLIGEERRYGAAWPAVLSVRPGLTGLWQVSGRSNTSYDQRVTLDMRYVTRMSLWWDLWILIRTIPTVFRGHGAY